LRKEREKRRKEKKKKRRDAFEKMLIEDESRLMQERRDAFQFLKQEDLNPAKFLRTWEEQGGIGAYRLDSLTRFLGAVGAPEEATIEDKVAWFSGNDHIQFRLNEHGILSPLDAEWYLVGFCQDSAFRVALMESNIAEIASRDRNSDTAELVESSKQVGGGEGNDAEAASSRIPDSTNPDDDSETKAELVAASTRVGSNQGY
jgi:hypothetical protein